MKKNKTYRYSYSVKFDRKAEDVRFGMVIKTLSGVEIGGAVTSSNITNSLRFIPAKTRLEIEFTFRCIVNTGIYFLNAGVLGNVGRGDLYLHRLIDACAFRVTDLQDCASAIVDFGCVSEIRELCTG